MPIQKDRSKDLPGKDGYSWRDREKLIDVVKHPEKYGVDPDYDNGDNEHCWDKFLTFLFLSTSVLSYLHMLFMEG